MFSATPRPHRRIFYIGCCLLAVELAALGVIFAASPVVPAKIFGVIATSGVGGQAGAILAGLELGFEPLALACVLLAFNLMHLCLFFPLITTLYEQCARVRFLGKWLISTRRVAEKQKNKVMRMGAFGLPLFIWLPFPWTGTLVGAVIGYLMGLRTSNIMLIALPSMSLSVFTWIYGVNFLRLISGVRGELTVLVILMLVGLFTFIRLQQGNDAEQD
jgi:uncharacterized membrane protein